MGRKIGSTNVFRCYFEHVFVKHPVIEMAATATGLGWEGIAPDGTTWRAAVEPKVKRGYRFTVERRLLGKSWRGKSADTLDTATQAEAICHAHTVLSRIAVEGG